MSEASTFATYVAEKKYGMILLTLGCMIFLAGLFGTIALAGNALLSKFDKRVSEIVRSENKPIHDALDEIKCQNDLTSKIQFDQVLSSGRAGYDKVRDLQGEALYDKLDKSQNGEAIRLALSIPKVREILRVYDPKLTIFLLEYFKIEDSV